MKSRARFSIISSYVSPCEHETDNLRRGLRFLYSQSEHHIRSCFFFSPVVFKCIYILPKMYWLALQYHSKLVHLIK